MTETAIRKAPPPPAFIKNPQPTTEKAGSSISEQNQTTKPKDIYIPTNRPDNTKNELASASTFSKKTEDDLFETFGQEVMEIFITNSDRIGAVYVIMQSTINAYVEKNKLQSINHSIMPSDLDSGINGEKIRKIISDLKFYYSYFDNNSEKFIKNKENFNLQDPANVDVSNPESIIIYMTSLFKTISSLDKKNSANKDKNIHTPYESDMIDVAKDHRNKMWELAKQVKESIAERDAIIDEIAIPIIKKGYPIDARKLAANFLKESRLNPSIAFDALYNNPATFAPILIDKMPRKFFGMIKANPKDAIEINKSLGRFLKKYVS